MQIHDALTPPYSRDYPIYSPLKEFYLSNGQTLSVLSDAAGRVFARLSIGRDEIKLSSDRLIGLPRDRKCLHLKRFLDHSFVIISLPDKGAISCRFHPKGRGGGPDWSKPIVFDTVLNTLHYGPGLTIRHLERTFDPIVISSESGGIGHTTYTIGVNLIWDLKELICATKESSDVMGSWDNGLKIHVWKKDYYQQEIQQLTQQLNNAQMRHENLLAEMARLQQAIASRPLILGFIQQEQRQLDQAQMDRLAILGRIETFNQQIAHSQIDLNLLEEQRRARYGEIEALAKLVELVDQLRITGLPNPHPAITNFRNRTLETHHAARLEIPMTEGMLGQAVRDLEPLEAESAAATEKHVIALVGRTGAGKSTIVNHLLGLRLETNPATGQVRVADGQVEIARIGQNLIQSETYKTAIYERQGVPFTFADCGGFLDTRGIPKELSVVTSLRLTLEKALSTKVLLCFDTRDLEPLRGQSFKDTIRTVLRDFFIHYPDFNQSFAILFNRPVNDPDGLPYTVEDLRGIIAAFEEEARTQNDPIADLYAFAIREHGRYIYLYDPLMDASRETLHQSLNEMTGLASEIQRFNTPYSQALQHIITNQMIQVAEESNELYERRSLILTQIGLAAEQRNTDQENLRVIDTRIANLAERIHTNEAQLNQIPEMLFANRIDQINAELAALAENKVKWNLRFNAINNENYITYKTLGGNDWCVTDGDFILEPRKVF